MLNRFPIELAEHENRRKYTIDRMTVLYKIKKAL